MPLQMLGLARLNLFLTLSQKAAENFGEAWVGSAAEYGPMQEFGTSTIDERPHWRVAIPEVIAEVGGDQRQQGQVLDGMIASQMEGAGFGVIDSGSDAPSIVALKIERRVKQIITAKHIIDTGNYRASVSTGSTEESAFGKSAAKLPGKDVAK
tara:strand:+ start:1835 stop:2293 length:459 start_codon:yes stop_codon:yes gene_type:complete